MIWRGVLSFALVAAALLAVFVHVFLWSDDKALLSEIGCGKTQLHDVYPLPEAQKALVQGGLRILLIGSSSTMGVGAGGSGASYTARSAELLTGENVMVISRGMPSETAIGARDRMAEEIALHRPDLVVWQVGTNDAIQGLDAEAVEAVIREGIGIIRSAGDDVILLDPQYYPMSDDIDGYEAMVDRVGEVAQGETLGVIRRYDRMKRAGWRIGRLLAGDRLHMSDAGHECLARDVAAVIREGLSPVTSLPVRD